MAATVITEGTLARDIWTAKGEDFLFNVWALIFDLEEEMPFTTA
jgi:hypothetical protein